MIVSEKPDGDVVDQSASPQGESLLQADQSGLPAGLQTTDPKVKTIAPWDSMTSFPERVTSCRLIHIDIWFLESAEQTRVHVLMVMLTSARHDCEKRLDRATFFGATRDYVINLTHVKQTRLLDASRVLFVLPTGQEVIVSGPQNALFRKMRAL
jgi:hypothetical protein